MTAPLVIERARYRLEVAGHGRTASLRTPGGDELATLRLLAAVDRVGIADETLALEQPRLEGDTLTVERRSTAWARAGLTLTCLDDRLEVRAWVEGEGAITDAHLLAGRSLLPRSTNGYLPSGSRFRTLFSPNPSGALPPVRPEAEGAVIGVLGDGEPGRQHWLFTPAPLFVAVSTAAREADAEEWSGLWVTAPVEELTFVQLRYETAAGGFGIRLEYEGHTEVEGSFTTPTLVLAPALSDPFAGLERYRQDVVTRGHAPAETDVSWGQTRGHGSNRQGPPWWRAPIFCGWGAQCNLARGGPGIAADFATQEAYTRFLGDIAREGLVPGTITIDDKWQKCYGTNTPDTTKWPDLRGFIDECHAREQRVLLWWKAWDAEGLDPGHCITNPDGEPVAFDPSNPAAAEQLRGAITQMLAADGLDADGLKIDFTARTPSGFALQQHGRGWGIALLHRLLEIVYAAAKQTKPESLIVTHTPHSAFVDVTDMIRLKDMLFGDVDGPLPTVVPQMRFRGDVVRAVCPGLPIDTDDWSVPDLATWRDYLAAKLDIGVPALYYSTHVDATGEAFEREDYAALRRAWTQWEEQGSSPRR
jgi:hypothetical protein